MSEIIKDTMIEKFAEVFGGSNGISMYFAPGRVNLIGGHTDYNGGHVFPCALTLGTYIALRKREDKLLRMFSMNYEDAGLVETSLDELEPGDQKLWTDYPKGMIWAMAHKGFPVEQGMDMLICGNLPIGMGLSSSASLEMAVGYALNDMFDLGMDNQTMARIGQYSENKFKGVRCGIMDPFAILMGKKDHAIFINTSDLSYEYAPIELDDVKIVLASSNKHRDLSSSKYNERRQQCEKALARIQGGIGIDMLCDLTETQFEQLKVIVKDETCIKRARHAIYENGRTKKAVQALKNRDLELFGELMNQSHVSLRDDYEVSGEELDTLVEAAWNTDGVLGSRMTGAGFGGCTVSLVENDYVENFKEQVGKAYKEKIGYDADFYVVEAGDGPYKL